MTDSWDEGPVSALRARIQELEYEVAKQTDIAATASEQAAIWGAQRDRAVAAVKSLRTQLDAACVLRSQGHYEDAIAWRLWDTEVARVLAATAEWEAP